MSTTITVPTAAQAAWQDMELTMFAHFDPSVYQNLQGDDNSTPLAEINPKHLDVEQWLDAAESFGAKMIIFIAKHVGGFAWWRTDTTDYGVKDCGWKNGTGDLVGEVSRACARRGMKLGIYLNAFDRHLGAGNGGSMPTPEKQEWYRLLYRQQLTELLTNYGPITEIWFDGSLVFDVSDIVQKLAPAAIVFQSSCATIRWVGNESGYCPYPSWNAVSAADAASGIATARHGTTEGTVWLPVETDTTIRDHNWFWNRDQDHTLKSLDHLMDVYERSVGHGSVLLLNSNPDPSGRIPAVDMARYAEFGAEIRRRYGKPLAEATGSGFELILDLPGETAFDRVMTMEDIRLGERVRSYVLEGWNGQSWFVIASGTAIGHKKIDRFKPVRASRIRLRILNAVADPAIRRLAVFNTGVGLPEGATRDRSGAQRRVAGEWGPDLFRPSDAHLTGRWVTREPVPFQVDLTSSIEGPGRYVVEFSPTGGKDNIHVNCVELRADGKTVPDAVQGLSTEYAYNVTIPPTGEMMTLHTLIRCSPTGNQTFGELTVARVD
jgi:alpha-L-fucosidase